MPVLGSGDFVATERLTRTQKLNFTSAEPHGVYGRGVVARRLRRGRRLSKVAFVALAFAR